ncbi:type II toxin-antitoxin system PemK/MazF family toxin [Salinimicrobium sp. GXAS 041]|uniref:type II toxin-antitoxin system PemK/MazF family toxin n=1 Tax=Salinimicrobium sp. GXAS 041 TaxID=3400806 RepID=UPI003C76926C
MKKGDLVLISFPFTNLKGKKRRPAVILYKGEIDVVVCFITSKMNSGEDTDLYLEPDPSSNNLKVPSLVRTSKIATLEIDLITGKIGELRKEEIQLLNLKLRQLFILS